MTHNPRGSGSSGHTGGGAGWPGRGATLGSRTRLAVETACRQRATYWLAGGVERLAHTTLTTIGPGFICAYDLRILKMEGISWDLKPRPFCPHGTHFEIRGFGGPYPSGSDSFVLFTQQHDSTDSGPEAAIPSFNNSDENFRIFAFGTFLICFFCVFNELRVSQSQHPCLLGHHVHQLRHSSLAGLL